MSLQATHWSYSPIFRFSYERIWHFANSIEQDIDMSYPSTMLENMQSIFLNTKAQVKTDALKQARQNIQDCKDRCSQLRNMNEEQLSHQYLMLATTAYDKSCELYKFSPDATCRGRHIHKIAENLALLDRAQSTKCANYRYPFDGIEQCYLWGLKSGRDSFCLPCSVKPDLYNSLTGSALDYKTGSNKTELKRHLNNIMHLPPPRSGFITSKDVKVTGVEMKYTSRVPRMRA